MLRRRSTAALAAAAILVLGVPAPGSGGGCDTTGTPNDDHLVGSPGPDRICGLGGDDTIEGLGGADVLQGDGGKDILEGGTEGDELLGGPGNDQLVGGTGRDTANYSDGPGVRVDLVSGQAASGQGTDQVTGIEDVVGSDADDVLKGTADPNRLAGGGATDLLLGQGGPDHLLGGRGGDYLNGGPQGGQLVGGLGLDACLSGTAQSCYLRTFGDRNDTRGLMDIKKVRSRGGATTPNWDVVSARWTKRKVWDKGYWILFADTKGSAKPDYFVLAHTNGSKMRGGLYRQTPGGGEVRIGGASVAKSGPRDLTVRLPLAKVQRTRPYFRWTIQTLFTGSKCHKVCFDRSPGGPGLPQAVLSDV
jgi:Ca2+-binding RTX toxin-like protein